MANQRVLLVDLDPQANLTSGVGLKGQSAPGGHRLRRADGRCGTDVRSFVLPTSFDHLSLIPANRHLTGAEIELVTLDGARASAARDCSHRLRPEFRLHLRRLAAVARPAHAQRARRRRHRAVPLNCEYFALEGIAELMSTIERVRESLNPALAHRRRAADDVRRPHESRPAGERNIREYFGDQVYKTVIPRNVRLGEAPSHGVPVILYDARSRGAEAYVALAHEFARARPRRGAADRRARYRRPARGVTHG